jgi:tight adherence protein C
MQTIIAVLVFVSAGLLAYGVLEVFFSQERRVTRALRTVSSWEQQQALDAEPLLRPFSSRVLSPLVSGFAGRLRRLVPTQADERYTRRLTLAGDPSGLTAEGVLALQIAGAVGLPVLVIIVLALLRTGASLLPVAIVVASLIVGFQSPIYWLDELAKRRTQQIRQALPDMMDMLTISVQAGLGFDMALIKLIHNTSGPLAEEFGRMLNEVQAGVSRRDALRHLGERTDVPELDAFITAMVQADVFGVSVAGILLSQSLEQRKKRRQLVEELAQKAPVKMVFPTIFCMLPATMLVVLGPAVIAIGRTFGITP